MKQIIFLVLLAVGSITGFAQRGRDDMNDRNNGNMNDRNYGGSNDQRNPPQQVQQSFRRDNPHAADARWGQNNNQWHAQYRDRDYNNRIAQAYYDPRGRHVDTHIQWERSQLPRNVESRIYTRYHTRNYQVYRVVRPNSFPLFQIILNIGGGNRTVYVDENGNEVPYDDIH